MATTSTELRIEFFGWLFGESTGYVCLATAEPENARHTFKQKFFHWPTQKEQLEDYCREFSNKRNLWFCVNLLDKPERKKEFCINQNIVWADLDTCNPANIEPKPSLVIVSSPNRYQAIWKVDQVIPATVAEDYSRRLAYKYKQEGADPSGWDLTQLLRVPFTTNFKYEEKPLVVLNSGGSSEVMVTDFEEMEVPPLPGISDDEEGIPDTDKVPDPMQVIYSYQAWLDRSFFELYESEPTTDNDWSTRMWKLINLGFEAGMEPIEVYSIALTAKCNKYIRDARPMRFLWLEIMKAKKLQVKIDQVAGTWSPLLIPTLVDADSLPHDTFLDRYHEWATQATDAVPTYHELCGAILLSALLAANIRFEVSHSTIVPNLWGLVLGESTLTRKTTAMLLAMNLLNEVDPDAQMANDGTAEGILTGLSARPGRTSIFYKDEVSGLFDSINNKRYLAGVPETLTHLYDCPTRYVKMLSKSEVVISSPIFIFFGGGISEKTYSLLNDENVTSGFLPRFLVVNGAADLSRIRPTGPKNLTGIAAREKLKTELLDLREMYSVQGYMMVAGQRIPLQETTDRPMIQAVFSDEALTTYQEYEMTMLEAADASSIKDKALPTFERLSRSLMKLSMLLAASRQEPKANSFNVEKIDVQQAARFVQSWGRYSVDLILNVGKNSSLRLLEKIRQSIDGRPGVYRSELMRMHHLTSREMGDVISTLIDRGEIQRKVLSKRSERYWILH